MYFDNNCDITSPLIVAMYNVNIYRYLYVFKAKLAGQINAESANFLLLKKIQKILRHNCKNLQNIAGATIYNLVISTMQ